MRISDWSSDVCSSVLEDLHGVQDPLEGFVHEAIEAGALERQLETAATPPKERHPHMTLELGDLAADRSLGNAQLLCRPRECSMPCRGFKGTQRVKGRKITRIH